MAKKQFQASTTAEKEFAKALRKVAKISGHIVEAHTDGDTLHDEPEMQAALKAYSKLITPWAKRQAKKMLEKVARVNKTAFRKQNEEIGTLLQLNVADSEVGRVASRLMDEQVELIKSIPLRAGLRAQHLSRQAVYQGKRADEVAEELADSYDVSEAQAMCIARTEVARANASITQARAQSVGAKYYIWRTTMDGAERESHAKMNGKHVEYSREPELSDGTIGHAGTFPNCRCWQDPQFEG